MRKHELKTWPVYFEEIAAGRLSFSVRENLGRGFQKGDIAVLKEYDPNEERVGPEGIFKKIKGYTGRSMELDITYVESAWGITPNHVIIGFGSVPREVKS